MSLVWRATLATLILALWLAGGFGAWAEDRPAPTLNPDRLHHRWARALFPHLADCAWPTYHVGEASRTGPRGAPSVFRTLDEALAAAASDQVCGPTVVIEPGRYEVGTLVITKPTILQGAPGATLVGGIVNRTDAPMWLKSLELTGVPLEGGIFVSHPAADTTLIDVSVSSALGFGVVHNCGD